jgi:hypothetical protein
MHSWTVRVLLQGIEKAMTFVACWISSIKVSSPKRDTCFLLVN